MHEISIGVMATLVNDKYVNQLLACHNTWEIDCKKLNIPVFYFCGSHKTDIGVPNLIHLKGVKDDYNSATYKQWYGMKWMNENSLSKFYIIIGTDNYVNIQLLLNLISKYNNEHPLVIGGYGEFRNIGYNLYFPFGGGGIIVSKPFVDIISTNIDQLIIQWFQTCGNNPLRDACDVMLGHICWQYDIPIVREKQLLPCSWTGKFRNPDMDLFPIGMFNPNNIVICHYMEPNDMYLYRSILKLSLNSDILINMYYNIHHQVLKSKLGQKLRFDNFTKVENTVIYYGSNTILLLSYLKSILDKLYLYDSETLTNMEFRDKIMKNIKILIKCKSVNSDIRNIRDYCKLFSIYCRYETNTDPISDSTGKVDCIIIDNSDINYSEIIDKVNSYIIVENKFLDKVIPLIKREYTIIGDGVCLIVLN